MSSDEIWEIEKGFWLDGPKFYEEHMFLAAQMVFPAPIGILKGEKILEGLKAAPRWDAVEITERTELCMGDTLVLAYRATGTRGGKEAYVVLCSSTYARQPEAWKLISHQQTPVA